VEKVESAKLDDYDIGQLMACNGLTACFEAKFKSCMHISHFTYQFLQLAICFVFFFKILM
jgi:hypothetical protein